MKKGVYLMHAGAEHYQQTLALMYPLPYFEGYKE